MKSLLRKGAFDFRINTAFAEVIRACRDALRPGQDGTWITDEILEGYTELHKAGYAHSVEAWLDGDLVGGLYGVRLGGVFFGESMFSRVSNASKYAFIRWVEMLRQQGVVLIDCQVYTQHLESLGARLIPRTRFLQILREAVAVN
jgi:leucyl/phenylalanyl-tRNA--protein transferase